MPGSASAVGGPSCPGLSALTSLATSQLCGLGEASELLRLLPLYNRVENTYEQGHGKNHVMLESARHGTSLGFVSFLLLMEEFRIRILFYIHQIHQLERVRDYAMLGETSTFLLSVNY